MYRILNWFTKRVALLVWGWFFFQLLFYEHELFFEFLQTGWNYTCPRLQRVWAPFPPLCDSPTGQTCPGAPPLPPALPLLLRFMSRSFQQKEFWLLLQLILLRAGSWGSIYFQNSIVCRDKAFVTHPSCHGTDVSVFPPSPALPGRALVMLNSWNQTPLRAGYR